MCDPRGCDLTAFAQLLDDEEGLYMDDVELRDVLTQLSRAAVKAKKLVETYSVGVIVD